MVGRFALRGLHAKGGLGEVFTARDTELNREVAVKRIQSRYADDPSSRRRFLSEAEITARLDHPGVVPVFGLVSDGFGRPCYAMRFIRGETLKDELERYHGFERATRSADRATEKTASESKEPLPSPALGLETNAQPRSVMFRQLLQRFIAVCQAIGYAHTRKVIHRDIKPANVMVGAFGETLVVDWGLAKALDDGPDPAKIMKTIAESRFRHDPDATEMPSHMTLAGTAVGTPAYMAPEQASGKIELVGTAADIYSLGATLFAILTGKAPFSGSTPETLDRVRRGQFQPPRSVNPDTPAPLDAICCKAMALRPEDRYSTATDLAADVERWLSDEPVSCYRDPIFARLARWARRHPARVAAGVSLLLAGVLAAGGVAWAVNEGRKNTQAALDLVTKEEEKTRLERDRATEAEKKTAEERDRVTEEKKNTEVARKIAQERYELAVQAFNTLVTDIQKQLADRAGTQEFRAKLLTQAQKGLTELLKGAGGDHIGADRTLVAAHRQMGEVYQILGNTQEARREYDEAVRVARVVLSRTQTSWEAKRELGRSLLKVAEINLYAGDTAEARKAAQEARKLFQEVADTRPDDHEASADVATAEDQLSDIFMERGEVGPATEHADAALKMRQAITRARPDDLDDKRLYADSLEQFALLLLHVSRYDEARKVAEECVDVRKQVQDKQPEQPDVRRELAVAHATLGEIYLDRGNFATARTQYDDALDVLQKLVKDDPRNAAARAARAGANRRLSLIELRTGNLDAALSFATTARNQGEALEKDDPGSTRTIRDLAKSQEQLGEVLLARGKAVDALKAFLQSAAFLAPIQKKDPESVRAKNEYARSLECVGRGMLATGDHADAVKALTQSTVLREQVAGVDSDCARAKCELANALERLADAHRADGSPAKASDAVARAISLLREVVNKDAKNTPARRELATATGQWGEVLTEAGKPTAALIALSQSLDQFRSLAEADTKNTNAKADEAGAWERLATQYAELGQTTPAMAAARKALALRVEVAEKAGETKTAKRELAEAKLRIADTYTAIRHFDHARKWYKEARELVAPDPDDPATTATARSADRKLELLGAIETIMKDPDSGAANVAAELRGTALRMAMEWSLKGSQPTTAASLADQLAAVPKASATELYAAARTLARCAVADKITEQVQAARAKRAVETLEKAVKAGFTHADALKGSEWDICRKLEAFQKIVKGLEGK
jgi:serine/threonine protein kinase/tetratricopeptide (TPR) repeat protein